jgi:hypothetical protein
VTWVNLDDQMAEHPKIVGLSDGAFRLHISAIMYANRFLTDGVIAFDAVARLTPRFKKTYLDELLLRQIWTERNTNGTGRSFEIHDYLDWNKSRADVEKRRKVRADAGRKGAHGRWGDS